MTPPRSPLRRRAVLLGGGLAALGLAAGWALRPRARAHEAANPPRGGFVTVEGLRVHYVALGPADAPPVVLIHGATGNLNDMTFDLGPRLAERFRVIAFDRPGLGYTDRPARDGWDPAVQARILRAAARALGAARPVVVGHSWGAAVALAWAAEAPDAVRGVVSVSGVSLPWGAGDGRFTGLVTSRAAAAVGAAALRIATLRDGGAGAVARIFRPQAPPRGYLDHLQPELILRPASFRANVEDIQRLDGALARLAPRWPGIAVPVEILHGAADRITAPALHARALAARLPDARLTLVEGVGHMLHHARPEVVAEAVARVAAA